MTLDAFHFKLFKICYINESIGLIGIVEAYTLYLPGIVTKSAVLEFGIEIAKSIHTGKFYGITYLNVVAVAFSCKVGVNGQHIIRLKLSDNLEYLKRNLSFGIVVFICKAQEARVLHTKLCLSGKGFSLSESLNCIFLADIGRVSVSVVGNGKLVNLNTE